MVQLVEITGVLNEKGCIEIPIVLLAQTGIRTGEEVNLIYLAAGEKDYRNESKEQKTISRIPRAMHRLNRQCRRSRLILMYASTPSNQMSP